MAPLSTHTYTFSVCFKLKQQTQIDTNEIICLFVWFFIYRNCVYIPSFIKVKTMAVNYFELRPRFQRLITFQPHNYVYYISAGPSMNQCPDVKFIDQKRRFLYGKIFFVRLTSSSHHTNLFFSFFIIFFLKKQNSHGVMTFFYYFLIRFN